MGLKAGVRREKKEVSAQAGKSLQGFLTGHQLTEKTFLCSSWSQECPKELGKETVIPGVLGPTWNSAV